jgi:hypothetical protein
MTPDPDAATTPSLANLATTARNLVRPGMPSAAAEAAHSAEYYAAHSRAPGTFKRLNTDWRTILELCTAWEEIPLPMLPTTAEMIVAHLADIGRASRSIGNLVSTIRTAHRLAGHPDPTADPHFRAVFDGVKRELGDVPKDQKTALLIEHLLLIYEACMQRGFPRGLMDWCVLITTFFGSFRPAELTDMHRTDVTIDSEKASIFSNKSKTNQRGKQEMIYLWRIPNSPLCPVKALEQYISIVGDHSGQFFRALRENTITESMDPKTVSRIVKYYAGAVGMHPSELGSNSLRAGIVTQMLMNGAGEVATANFTRRASIETLKDYFRPGIGMINIAATLGLQP